MADKKHYIMTSVTLGAIAAASGLIIGLTNLITKDQIAKNEKNKINAGISEIYGKNATISKEYAFNDDEIKYVEYVYEIGSDAEEDKYIFRTTGSNMYGKVSLLVGVNYIATPASEEKAAVYQGVYVIVNEQTYASTLVDNYINPLNDGLRNLDDTSCGATYGATLVKNMVNEAMKAAEKLGKE